MPLPPEVITELLSKPLPELLNWITLGKLTGDALEWARKRVKELWEKKEYGFTLNPELASDLQRISKSEAYKRIKECIGNSNLLGLVKLGLRIEELSDEGKVSLIANIKNDVYKKYGVEGVRILTMGSTGLLMGIIQYLSSIKIENNYSQTYMTDLFNRTLDNWMNITIFHKTEQGQKALEQKILAYMNGHHELFFVFSIGTASEQATKVIATLNNNGTIRKKGYMFNLYSRKEDLYGRVRHTWAFQNLYNFEKISI